MAEHLAEKQIVGCAKSTALRKKEASSLRLQERGRLTTDSITNRFEWAQRGDETKARPAATRPRFQSPCLGGPAVTRIDYVVLSITTMFAIMAINRSRFGDRLRVQRDGAEDGSDIGVTHAGGAGCLRL